MAVEASDDISAHQSRLISWTSRRIDVLERDAAVGRVELIHANPGARCAHCERRPCHATFPSQAHDAAHSEKSHQRNPQPRCAGKS